MEQIHRSLLWKGSEVLLAFSLYNASDATAPERSLCSGKEHLTSAVGVGWSEKSDQFFLVRLQ